MADRLSASGRQDRVALLELLVVAVAAERRIDLRVRRRRGATCRIRLQLDTMAHPFRPGLRIRLQISGGAHPRYARNLGTEEDPATRVRMVPSVRAIAHGDGGLSRVVLP